MYTYTLREVMHMGKKAIDMTGKKFGRWTVLDNAERPVNSTQTGLYWLCVCECGTRVVKYGNELRSRGGSCGCLKSEMSCKRMKKMQHDKYGELSDRFFSRFKKSDSGCWEWTAHRDKDGYGFMPASGTSIRAHRFSYEYHYGEIPNGLVVCHKCDNPGCVNPDHLFVGTIKDNCRDMLSKERDAMIGSRNNKAILSEQQALEIKYSKEKTSVIAKKYSVSTSTVKRIRSGKSWSHLQ
jgi:hypothetical protein